MSCLPARPACLPACTSSLPGLLGMHASTPTHNSGPPPPPPIPLPAAPSLLGGVGRFQRPSVPRAPGLARALGSINQVRACSRRRAGAVAEGRRMGRGGAGYRGWWSSAVCCCCWRDTPANCCFLKVPSCLACLPLLPGVCRPQVPAWTSCGRRCGSTACRFDVQRRAVRPRRRRHTNCLACTPDHPLSRGATGQSVPGTFSAGDTVVSLLREHPTARYYFRSPVNPRWQVRGGPPPPVPPERVLYSAAHALHHWLDRYCTVGRQHWQPSSEARRGFTVTEQQPQPPLPPPPLPNAPRRQGVALHDEDWSSYNGKPRVIELHANAEVWFGDLTIRKGACNTGGCSDTGVLVAVDAGAAAAQA